MGVRDFKGPGSRAMAAYERSFQLGYMRWSRKFLVRETRNFLDKELKKELKKADKPDKRREYAGTLAELVSLFETWFKRGYSRTFKDMVKLEPDPSEIFEAIRFETTERAEYELSKLRIDLYDSIRDYIAKLGRYQQRHDVPPPTEAFIRRQLMGQPGPAPQQWAGAPTPPAYRFRNKKLTTFGRNGVDGADINEDPFGLAARARMIARTELGQARNAGADAALEELGAEYKMWSSFDDGGTRRSHRHIDGAVVPAGEPFRWKSKQPGRYKGRTVKAMAPGALTLPPAERINCRCTITYATEKEFKSWRKRYPGKVIKHG